MLTLRKKFKNYSIYIQQESHSFNNFAVQLCRLNWRIRPTGQRPVTIFYYSNKMTYFWCITHFNANFQSEFKRFRMTITFCFLNNGFIFLNCTKSHSSFLFLSQRSNAKEFNPNAEAGDKTNERGIFLTRRKAWSRLESCPSWGNFEKVPRLLIFWQHFLRTNFSALTHSLLMTLLLSEEREKQCSVFSTTREVKRTDAAFQDVTCRLALAWLKGLEFHRAEIPEECP